MILTGAPDKAIQAQPWAHPTPTSTTLSMPCMHTDTTHTVACSPSTHSRLHLHICHSCPVAPQPQAIQPSRMHAVHPRDVTIPGLLAAPYGCSPFSMQAQSAATSTPYTYALHVQTDTPEATPVLERPSKVRKRARQAPETQTPRKEQAKKCPMDNTAKQHNSWRPPPPLCTADPILPTPQLSSAANVPPVPTK
jgi:hypothetical protein